jgi:SAM-dependent methyltransferase
MSLLRTRMKDRCGTQLSNLVDHAQPRMPDPAVYEQEYKFWPWGGLLATAAAWLKANAPPNGHVIDYMCGTGFLLNRIAELRPDLTMVGCDISQEYVDYANRQYPAIDVRCADALHFVPQETPGVVICTAGLHHLVRSRQDEFIRKVAIELASGSIFVLGEEVIRDFQTEGQRRAAALEMGHGLLSYALNSDAPNDVLAAAIDVLGNDLLERGEYKLSDRMIRAMLQPAFELLSVNWIWGSESIDYGDLLYFCKRR